MGVRPGPPKAGVKDMGLVGSRRVLGAPPMVLPETNRELRNAFFLGSPTKRHSLVGRLAWVGWVPKRGIGFTPSLRNQEILPEPELRPKCNLGVLDSG